MEESRIEPVLGLNKYCGTRSRSTAAAPDLVLRWRNSAKNCLKRTDKMLTDYKELLFLNCVWVWSRAFQHSIVNYMYLNHSDANINIYIRTICL